ncbi:MAG: DUF4417 domain-containing protein [Firmicutes bacterium]|nr:DUF4417 domain-containing protein [Bacillota bacterium]
MMRSYAKNQRIDVFRSELAEGADFSGALEFPALRKTDFKPVQAVSFDKAAKTKYYRQWVHFYIHDYRFERVWNNPKQYLPLLKRFEGVITPDFSLYRELPLVMQMWNTYRSRTIGYWLQNNGVNIVPNVRWGDERTYEFAFDGLERGGTVAVSTYGCIRNRADRYYFAKGLGKMVEELRPETIVNYSYTPDDIFLAYKNRGINVIEIENYHETLGKAAK